MLARPAKRPGHHALLLGLSFALGCGGDEPAGPSGPVPTSIGTEPTSVELDQADSLRLTVSVFDADEQLLTGVAVSFTSANPGWLSVSPTGLVRSTGRAGTSSITVAAGSGAGRITRAVSVTVRPITATLQVSPSNLNLPQGKTEQLDVAVRDPFGAILPGALVSFTNLAPPLVTVSPTGLVSAGLARGNGAIRVEAGSLSVIVPVVVTPVPSAIRASPSTIGLVPGLTWDLDVTVIDAGGQAIPGAPISYQSSAPTVATVDQAGVVRALTPGRGMITIWSDPHVTTVPFSVATVGTTIARSSLPWVQPYDVAISTHGVLYSAALDSGVIRAQVPDFSLSPALQPGRSFAVAFDPTGTSAFVSGIGAPDVISRVDPASNAVLATSGPLPAEAFALAVSPDGSRLYAGLASGSVVALEPVALTVLKESVATPGYVNHVAVHPTNGRVYASSPGNADVLELDGSTLEVVRRFTAAGHWQGLAVTPGGNTLIVANQSGSVQTWDLVTGARAAELPAWGGFGLAISPDGHTAWVSRTFGVVERMDLFSESLQMSYQVGGVPRKVAIHPDGSLVAVANEAGWVDFIAP